MTKKEARKEALIIRKNIDCNQISKEILEKIIASKVIEDKKNVAIYYPLKDEINLLGLLDYYKNINFYLPVTKKYLEFVYFDKNTTLVDGPFNTKEPIGLATTLDKIDCIIIPCVAIAKDNKRIGYGKGYYDKTLVNYQGLKIGVCHPECIGFDCKMDEYDLTLDLIF